jgi:predicted transcriptional regulator
MPFLFFFSFAGLALSIEGETSTLPDVKISGEAGGLPGGTGWESFSMREKTNILFYVDPDKKGEVSLLINALDSLQLDKNKFGMVFVVNTSATFVPDFILRKKIADRAEVEKNKTYVLDQERVLVKKWGLIDDDVNILLFDADGNVLFRHAGTVTQNEIDKIINKIKQLIN